MATSRPPVARNRLPLFPQQQTFSWPSLTSGFDPKPTFGRYDSPHSGVPTTSDLSIRELHLGLVSTRLPVSFIYGFGVARGFRCPPSAAPRTPGRKPWEAVSMGHYQRDLVLYERKHGTYVFDLMDANSVGLVTSGTDVFLLPQRHKQT